MMKNAENDLYELHDNSDDIYYVLDGEATLALGGELAEPNEISPGEWRSKTVKGGNPFEIKKGRSHRRPARNGASANRNRQGLFDDPDQGVRGETVIWHYFDTRVDTR
jgi:hypothetical protein